MWEIISFLSFLFFFKELIKVKNWVYRLGVEYATSLFRALSCKERKRGGEGGDEEGNDKRRKERRIKLAHKIYPSSRSTPTWSLDKYQKRPWVWERERARKGAHERVRGTKGKKGIKALVMPAPGVSAGSWPTQGIQAHTHTTKVIIK